MKNNIKQYRENVGMTQHELGVAAGLDSVKPQTVIYNYEKSIRTPSLHTCRMIVMALNKAGGNVTIDAVFPMDLNKTA